MKILALDTALGACSIAVMDGSNLLAHFFEERARGHAETLLPSLKALMGEIQISFDDLDLIAVSVGPGTFTGLRIGLSAARGIALASSTPCIGITTLEALAASVPRETSKTRSIVVATDARRNEVYLQTFLYNDTAPHPVSVQEARAVPIDEVEQYLPVSSFVILGSGADLLLNAEQIDTNRCEILDLDENPDARIIASLARAEGIPEPNSPPPAPVYLRSPDAKLPGGKDLKPASDARS